MSGSSPVRLLAVFPVCPTPPGTASPAPASAGSGNLRGTLGARLLVRLRATALGGVLLACSLTPLGGTDAVGQEGWRAIRLPARGLTFASGLAISPDERKALVVLGNEERGYEAHVLDVAKGTETVRFVIPLMMSADDALWGKRVVVLAGQATAHETGSSVLFFPAGAFRGDGRARSRPGRPLASVPLQTQSVSGPVASNRASLALSADERWLAAVSVPADRSWEQERGAVTVLDVRRTRSTLLSAPGTWRCVAPLFTQRVTLELGVACLTPDGRAQWHVFGRERDGWKHARFAALPVPDGVRLQGESARATRDETGDLWIAWALDPAGLVQRISESGETFVVQSLVCPFVPEDLHSLAGKMMVVAAQGSVYGVGASAGGAGLEAALVHRVPIEPVDEAIPGARPVFSASGRLVLAGMHGLPWEGGYESPVLSLVRLDGRRSR